MKPTNNPQ